MVSFCDILRSGILPLMPTAISLHFLLISDLYDDVHLHPLNGTVPRSGRH